MKKTMLVLALSLSAFQQAGACQIGEAQIVGKIVNQVVPSKDGFCETFVNLSYVRQHAICPISGLRQGRVKIQIRADDGLCKEEGADVSGVLQSFSGSLRLED